MPLCGTLTKDHIFKAVFQNNGYIQQKDSESVVELFELIKSTL